MNEVKYHGQWWFHNNPNDKFYGFLTLNNNQVPILEISDYLDTIPESKIIHGLAEGKYFTLFECQEASVSIKRIDATVKIIKTKTYYANRCIKGSLINNEFEKVRFTSAILSYTFSSIWGNTSKIIKADRDNNTFEFECEQGEDKTYNTSIGTITICQESTLKKGCNEISWKSGSYIKVVFPTSQNFEEVHYKVIYLLQKFLTLLINKSNYLTTIKLELEEKQNSFIQLVDFDIDDRYTSSREVKNNLTFDFSDIEKRFDEIIEEWIKINDIASNPIDNYFFNQYYTRGYAAIENQFLSLVQVIEGYHKKVINPSKKTIYLKDRISDFLKRYKPYTDRLFKPSAMILQKDENNLAELIKNTRNYYSHLGEKNKTILSPEEMIEGRFTLKLLFRACLLEKLNFDDQEIKNILLLTR